MLPQQTKLPLAIASGPVEAAQHDRVERSLGFLSAGIAAILENLPLPRRALSDSTKALRVRVTLERRNGFCPCCQRVRVCDENGKLPRAEFDHWYRRDRTARDESWMICNPCNRELEIPAFKVSVRSAFYAYQAAVLVFMVEDAEAQKTLFDGGRSGLADL